MRPDYVYIMGFEPVKLWVEKTQVCISARRCVWTKGPVGGNIEYKLDIWILRISVVTFLFIDPLLAKSCNLYS